VGYPLSWDGACASLQSELAANGEIQGLGPFALGKDAAMYMIARHLFDDD
jgi:hypothetical protein